MNAETHRRGRPARWRVAGGGRLDGPRGEHRPPRGVLDGLTSEARDHTGRRHLLDVTAERHDLLDDEVEHPHDVGAPPSRSIGADADAQEGKPSPLPGDARAYRRAGLVPIDLANRRRRRRRARTRCGGPVTRGMASRRGWRPELHPFHAVSQRVAWDAELLRRPRQIPSRTIERLDEPLALGTLEHVAKRVRAGSRLVIPCIRARHLLQAERAGGHHARVGEQARALDDVRQLAHVARPRVRDERAARVVAEDARRQVVIGACATEEVLGKEQHVLTTLTQGRELDGDDREPVIQVGAEAAGLDRGVQILARRRDDGDVDRIAARRAEPADLALLDHLEELRLQRLGEETDLVEEERPLVRRLEQSRLRRARAGERATLVAEHLGLEQRLGDRRAVDVRERTGRARAARVDRARDEPLAGARLAADQDRRQPPSARCLLEQPDDLRPDGDDRGARADQRGERLRDRVAHMAATADAESTAEGTVASLSHAITARTTAQSSTALGCRTTVERRHHHRPFRATSRISRRFGPALALHPRRVRSSSSAGRTA